MEQLVGALLAETTMSRYSRSAMPDAPVVPHVEPKRPMRAARAALARGLNRAAVAVAPAGEPHLAH